MKHSTTIVVLGIIVSGFSVIMMLLAMAEKPFRYRQHFMRTYGSDSLMWKAELPLEGEYYIAGATSDRFYFGDKDNPLSLVVTDSSINVIEHLHLPVQATNFKDLRGSYIEVDYPNIYLKAGHLSGIYVYNIDTIQESVFHKLPFFQRAIPVGRTCFALQTHGKQRGSDVLNNLLLLVPAQVSIPPKAKTLSADMNSYFASQGILRYCPELQRLVYAHYYRNEIIVMDTSLNVLYGGTTIDTISHAQIYPREVKEGFYTMASTPAVVNISAQVSGKELHIHSNLSAKNDNQKLFEHVSVIDVYDIETLKYRYSFYIPDYNDLKMKTFRVFNNRIVAIYPGLVVLYSHKDAQDQRTSLLAKNILLISKSDVFSRTSAGGRPKTCTNE